MCDAFVLSLLFRVVFDVKTVFFDLVPHSFACFRYPPIHVFLDLVPFNLPKVGHWINGMPSILWPDDEIPSLNRQPCRSLASQYDIHPLRLRTMSSDRSQDL